MTGWKVYAVASIEEGGDLLFDITDLPFIPELHDEIDLPVDVSATEDRSELFKVSGRCIFPRMNLIEIDVEERLSKNDLEKLLATGWIRAGSHGKQ